jgi:hypothetical protein
LQGAALSNMQIIYELSVGNERLEVRVLVALPDGIWAWTGVDPACQHDIGRDAHCCVWSVQRENAALRQHVLDVRRASRAAGLELNATSFLPIPVRP